MADYLHDGDSINMSDLGHVNPSILDEEEYESDLKRKQEPTQEEDFSTLNNTRTTIVSNGSAGKKPAKSILRNSRTDEIAITNKEYEERQQKKETLYFLKSPNKRIDYVIAFEEESVGSPLRVQFEQNLVKSGVELEVDDKNESSDNKTYYVKIHCPWEVLAKGAEMLNMKKKLGIFKDATRNLSQKNYGCCSFCYPNKKIVNEEDEEFFTAAFDSSRMEIFDIGDRETFFNDSERSLIAKLVLDWGKYEVTSADGKTSRHMGVESLINRGVYKAAYPLHQVLTMEGPKGDPHFFDGEDKDRQKLYHTWARFRNVFRYQPLELIRDYFGEKVGIYFAWVGLYTVMLIPASIAGLIVFLYGIGTMPSDPVVKDICSKEPGTPGDFDICPLCDNLCPYKKLSDSCQFARITHVFDNYATVAMAVFMSAWALIFLEMWKRREKELQYDWDMMDYEVDEAMRPAFQVSVKGRKLNPVTNELEPHVKGYNRCCRLFTSFTCVLFLIALVVGSIFGVIVYRVIVVSLFYNGTKNVSDTVNKNSKLIITVTSAIINLLIITVLQMIYKLIAKVLTDMELHRTQTEYEDAYTFKMIIFQFVNYYGSIFYIAYFKGSFIAEPGQTSMYLFGYRQDQCDPTGCFVELTIQLAIIMVGKQILTNVAEYIVPTIMNKCRSRDNTKKEIYMRWEQDLDLQPTDQLGLFYEYLEIVIQFGFVTLFVAAFPLAPLFALLNNIFEIRLDATKLVKLFQRAPAYRAQDIGAWLHILRYIAYCAVITNAFIIAWTSEFIPKVVYIFTENDQNLDNYVSKTLSSVNSSVLGNYAPDIKIDPRAASVHTCRYRDYTYSTAGSEILLGFTIQNWITLAARLAFVIVFEHVCFLLIFVVSKFIPDVPARVKRLSRYERQLNKAIAYQSRFNTDGKSLLEHIIDSATGNELNDIDD